jgi:5-methylcytosine-specific restriction endonuclease McrA
MINWENLMYLINSVPRDAINNGQKKEKLQSKMQEELMDRDDGICFVCGKHYLYGSSNPFLMSQGEKPDYKVCHLHHIVPNGKAVPENFVTLCTHCHQMIHQLLYIDGRWKYARPL